MGCCNAPGRCRPPGSTPEACFVHTQRTSRSVPRECVRACFASSWAGCETVLAASPSKATTHVDGRRRDHVSRPPSYVLGQLALCLTWTTAIAADRHPSPPITAHRQPPTVYHPSPNIAASRRLRGRERAPLQTLTDPSCESHVVCIAARMRSVKAPPTTCARPSRVGSSPMLIVTVPLAVRTRTSCGRSTRAIRGVPSRRRVSCNPDQHRAIRGVRASARAAEPNRSGGTKPQWRNGTTVAMAQLRASIRVCSRATTNRPT